MNIKPAFSVPANYTYDNWATTGDAELDFPCLHTLVSEEEEETKKRM